MLHNLGCSRAKIVVASRHQLVQECSPEAAQNTKRQAEIDKEIDQMRKALVHTLALCALGLAAPVVAETLYVPVAEPLGVDGAPLATELQISNYDLTDRPYTATFLASEGRETAKSGRVIRDVVPADQAVVLDKIAPAGQAGLLRIEAEPGMLVDGFVKTASRGVTYITGVPVISRFNQVAANDTALLNGLGRDVTNLALVNLGTGAAACHVDFLRADGNPVRVVKSEVALLASKVGLRPTPAGAR
jgi:hypothetical protein